MFYWWEIKYNFMLAVLKFKLTKAEEKRFLQFLCQKAQDPPPPPSQNPPKNNNKTKTTLKNTKGKLKKKVFLKKTCAAVRWRKPVSLCRCYIDHLGGNCQNDRKAQKPFFLRILFSWTEEERFAKKLIWFSFSAILAGSAKLASFLVSSTFSFL